MAQAKCLCRSSVEVHSNLYHRESDMHELSGEVFSRLRVDAE